MTMSQYRAVFTTTTTLGIPQPGEMSIPGFPSEALPDMPLDYNGQPDSGPQGNEFTPSPDAAPYQPQAQPPVYSVPVLSDDYSEPHSASQWLTA